MPHTKKPFEDFKNLLSSLPQEDSCAVKAANKAVSSRGNSLGSFGRLGQIYTWLAAWQASKVPGSSEAHICLFAASHEKGADSNSLAAILEQASQGRAAVNALCKSQGIGLRVLEMALEMPVRSPVDGAISAERDAMAAIAFGMESTASGGHILALGDIAYGNEANTLVILSALLGDEPFQWAGVEMQEDIINHASACLKAHPDAVNDGLKALCAFGGREVAAMMGGIVAARSQRIPVLLDGWAALAAATILKSLKADSLDHCMAASSASKAQAKAWETIGLPPLLQLDLDMGQGCGAALAIGILKSAVDLFSE